MPPKIKGKKPKKPRKPRKEVTQKQKQTVIVNIGNQGTRKPPKKKGSPSVNKSYYKTAPILPTQGMIIQQPTAQQIAYEVKRINDVEPKRINESKIKNIFDEYLAQERIRAVGLDSQTIPLDEQSELLNPKTFKPREEEPIDNFDNMTVNMLKARLREIGVSTSGNKKTLINRLREYEL